MNKSTKSSIPAGERFNSLPSLLVRAASGVKYIVFSAVTVFIKYWTKPIAEAALVIKSNFSNSQSKTRKLVTAALLSSTAAVLQSAGALGGPGFAVSALVTLPISIASIIAVHSGISAYLTTLLLLAVIQPSEILVFPFTTGLLGLGIGLSYRTFKKRAVIISISALALTFGISILLYLFRFPILGPIASYRISPVSIICIYIFSYLYSWLWVEVCMINLKFLSKAL